MTEDQDFVGCPFFEESSDELLKHEKVSSKNESVLLKRYEICCQVVKDPASKGDKQLADILTSLQKLYREHELLESKVRRGEETNKDLHSESHNLRLQVKEKNNEMPLLAQEADLLREKLREIQADENEKKSEMELQHKSVLLTKDQYKKCLGCHVRLLKTDDQGSILVFKFENSVPGNTDPFPPKSAKFSYSLKKEWKLLETNPLLPNIDQLSTRLNDSQDIQGLLAYLKNSFKSQTKQRIKSKEN